MKQSMTGMFLRVIGYQDAGKTKAKGNINGKKRGEKMNLNNLKPGMKVKNYKELCKLLEIEPKTSNSKKKQLKEIDEVIKYEKSGQAFTIKEIYDKKTIKAIPAKPRDKRYKNPKNIYSKYIQHVLLQYLNFNTTDGIIYMTKTDIYKMLGLVNKSFGSVKSEKEFLEIFNHITMEEINIVKTQACAKMNSILKSALNSLRSKRLISYFTVVTLQELDGTFRTATDNEIQKIDTIEHDILKELGCSYIWEIYEKKIYRTFYDKVEEEMEKEGWKYAQRKLKIIFTNEYIVEEMNKLSIELEKIQLNEELMLFLKKDLEKRHEKFNQTYKPAAIGINKIYEEMIHKPENALYAIPKEECMEKYSLIADSFIKYVISE